MEIPQRAERAESFRHIGEDYQRYRPGYPDAAVDWMLAAAARPVRRVLDLGAGTGKLTDALVARGLDVVAVDPSEQMLQQLASRHPQVEVHVAAAEELPLDEHSVDAVVVGQAWHWMGPQATGAQLARALRPGGGLAMAWNAEVPDQSWQQDFDRVQQVTPGKELNTEPERDPHPGAGFAPFEQHEVRWSWRTTAEDFLQVHKTHSAWLVADEATRREREAAWRRVLDEHGLAGELQVPMLTELWRTHLAH